MIQCVCVTCGAHFEAEKSRKYCCDKCRRDFQNQRQKKEREEKARKEGRTINREPKKMFQLALDFDHTHVNTPRRRCHDCGRPTVDYRCEECRKKWRLKHGVELEECDDDLMYDV